MTDDREENSTSNRQDYWAIVCRRRWWLLLGVFGAWTAVSLLGWFLPADYRSETVILVEQQKVPEQYVIPNVSVDLQERLHSMTQQILSRTRLRRIIDSFHLYASERNRLSPDELVDQLRQDVKIDLVKAPGSRDELTAFKIYYISRDPNLAQQVTSQLTSLFIEENLRARQQQSESTTGFLENQLDEAGKDLAAQEQRVREFKTRYLGELPGQLQSNVQILSGLQSRLQGAIDARDRVKQQQIYYESLLGQYRSLQAELRRGKSADLRSPEALDAELERLKNQMADLTARYTARHPDVKHLKEEIAATESVKSRIETEIKAARSKPEQVGSDSAYPRDPAELRVLSPVLEIESQLKASQLEMQNRQREIENLESSISAYENRLNSTPLREQQLANVTRDYDQSKANYESLLAKKNQSELATNLEKRQQGEQFRILDPPSLPTKPYWPDRFEFNLFGLVAGLIVGFAALVGAEALDDRVHGEKDLRSLIVAPVVVDIPSLKTRSETRMQQWKSGLEWVGGVMILGVIVAGSVFGFYRG
jgi:succinoglycan biosynthesis transport protein ExoP